MKPIRLALWLAIGCVGALLYAVTAHFFDAPPVRTLSLTESDHIVVVGGFFELRVHRTNVRLCPSQTSRMLWKMEERDGASLPIYYPIDLPPVRVRREVLDFVLIIPVPTYVKPGDYNYASNTIYSCGVIPALSGDEVFQSIDIPVGVAAPKSVETLKDIPAPIVRPAP